jgi:hypothetical protein
VKNDGHSSKHVTQLIEDRCKELFNVDIRSMTKWTMSDTTVSARDVAKYFDESEQEDCRMHILRLCIAYGIGLKDNIKTTKTVNATSKGVVNAIREVVTPGGSLPEGTAVIRKLRALNNLFCTPKLMSQLVRIQDAHDLPRVSPLFDIDVRVASTCRLMRRSFMNCTAMEFYFMEESKANVFTALTSNDWTLAREMEAITRHLAQLALSEVQS